MVAISSVLNHIINEQVNIIVNMIKIFNDQETGARGGWDGDLANHNS